jgi:hypothetical protein
MIKSRIPENHVEGSKLRINCETYGLPKLAVAPIQVTTAQIEVGKG